MPNMRRLSRSMKRAPGGARPASATVIGAIVVGDGTVVKEELTALAPAGTTCLIEAFAYPPSDAPFCSGLHEALMGPAEVLRERGSDAILIACTTARTSGGKAANCSEVIGDDMPQMLPIFPFRGRSIQSNA